MFGALAGPAAWAAQFGIIYSATPGLCGRSHVFVLLHLLTLGCLAVTFSALVVSVRSWRAVQGESDAPRRVQLRARSLAYAGILASSFFLLVIVATAIPTIYFDPCLH